MSQFYDLPSRQWLSEDAYHAIRASRRRKASSDLPMPYIAGDIKEYKSVVSGKMISSRSAQREDLARTNCRVLEPGEFTPEYRNPKIERKYSKAARKAR